MESFVRSQGPAYFRELSAEQFAGQMHGNEDRRGFVKIDGRTQRPFLCFTGAYKDPVIDGEIFVENARHPYAAAELSTKMERLIMQPVVMAVRTLTRNRALEFAVRLRGHGRRDGKRDGWVATLVRLPDA